MARKITTGLDIGSSFIRVAVCEYKDGQKIPEVLALVKKQSRGLRRGYIVAFDETVDAIAEALTEAERLSGLRIKNVNLGIGGVSLESRMSDGLVMISKADAIIGEQDINRVIEESEQNLHNALNNRSIIHRIPLSYKIDGKKLYGRPEGQKGNKLEVRSLFIVAQNQHVEDLVKAVETAGVRVGDIVASPLAAALPLLSKVQKTAGCVLANIGSQTTSVVLFEDNLPMALNVFPLGSNDITNDIALVYRINLDEAEKIKRGEMDPQASKKKLGDIISARLYDIFEFIENHLKKIGRSGLLPAGIIITGGGSNVPEIDALAKDYFKLPAKVAEASIQTASGGIIKDTAWSVAYGLCLISHDKDIDESFSNKIISSTGKGLLDWLRELLP